MKSKISVIIPLYNSEKYLSSTIESILEQTYTNWELILMDDNSTDNTLEIARSYKDKRIKIYESIRHLGIARIRQRAISYARGKYIALIDADDLACQKRLELQYKYLEEDKNLAFVGSWFRRIDNQGKLTRISFTPFTNIDYIKAKLLFGNCFAQPTVMIRKSILKKYGYRVTYEEASDYNLWVRISYHYKLLNLPQVLTLYRVHANNASLTATVKTNIARANTRIFRSQFKKIGLTTSRKELQTHSDLESKLIFSLPELTQTAIWLRKLAQFNAKKNVYNKTIFNYLISQYWFRVCGLAAKNGMTVYTLYKNSSLALTGQGGFKLKIILRILCLLRLNNSFNTYSYLWYRFLSGKGILASFKFFIIYLPLFLIAKTAKKVLITLM